MELGRVYFEKYKVLDVLGQGGTSNVYLAENIKIGNKWAIKKVTYENNINLLAEPNILKHLDHRSIPKIIDIEEDNESIYIIEEFVDGINLKSFKLQNEIIDIKRILIWILQLCDVLRYLHNRSPHPIIYRDLKPDNIMVMENDQVKLIDFGIAREYKEESNNDTVPIGTRGYAAPEQYGIGQSDERTDIFSLGITIYFLLTGKNLSHPPYKIQIPEQIHTDIESELFNIVLKCCEILPDNRYQSIDELEHNIKMLNDHKTVTELNINKVIQTQLDESIIESDDAKESSSEKVFLKTTRAYKKFKKKLKRDDNLFQAKQTVIIGALGVNEGIGVTHTSIMLASYLSEKGTVALVELNSKRHFYEIGMNAVDDKDLQNKCFIYNQVHYFWDINYSYFLTQYREKFDFIILDLGHYSALRGLDEFLRTDIRLVIGHGMDWKVKELIDFNVSVKEFDPNNSWIYLIPLMDKKTIKGIKPLIKKKTYPMPFNMNPFMLNSDTIDIFDTLFK